MKKILFALWLCTQSALAVPITITVQDEKGAPIAGALVQTENFPKSIDGQWALSSPTTRANGTVEFDLPLSTSRDDWFGDAVG